MLDELLPRRIDNAFRGHRIAVWLLALIVLMKGAIGLGTLFNGHHAAVSADGIPLDTFTSTGKDAFISIFAAWGLSQVIINLIGLLVLVRYRAMVPFMFALLLLEHVGR